MTFTRPRLEDYIALALAAGREIMAVRAAGFQTLDKLDGSPVTLADQRAEAVIEAGLAALAPGAPMIGEEAVAAGRIPETGHRFFCVDPLDGTRDFVAKGSEFTVNIALIENGAPVQGVVFAPVSGAMFAGEAARALKGRYDAETGAMIEALAPIRVSPHAPSDGLRVITSRRDGATQPTLDFCARLGAHTQASASSSIKFCAIAEGRADLYPRHGEMNEWDAAAGHAVLAAAGGGVMDLKGAPLRYGARGDAFTLHGLVAFGGADAERAARAALD